MLKKTITYTDYEGQQITQDFYFNLSKAEIMDMQYSTEGGMEKRLNRIIKSQNQPEIYKLFKDLVLKAYGEKSEDGRRFIKSKALSEAFSQTEAYSELMIELFSKDDAPSEFLFGILPPDLATAARDESAKQENKLALAGTADE